MAITYAVGLPELLVHHVALIIVAPAIFAAKVYQRPRLGHVEIEYDLTIAEAALQAEIMQTCVDVFIAQAHSGQNIPAHSVVVITTSQCFRQPVMKCLPVDVQIEHEAFDLPLSALGSLLFADRDRV